MKLSDQPFQFLAALLERPGQLVTRDELRQRLWPADTFVDFEHGLNAAVKRLRETLGDPADAPRFIEAVPRVPRSVSWSRDGMFVLFSAEETTVRYLWRVAFEGKSRPERIELAGPHASFLGMSPTRRSPGFSRVVVDDDVYRWERGQSAEPVAQSSVYDGNAQFSPDGRQTPLLVTRG